ncbi:glycosyltransferase [Scytonema hofmannii FACHB-248]|uniref:4,4'-diaponeurosporenoate glycosyltransferase n=2 Tax=Cyanophyceae TaxID=3028117 RepID=A0ABR8GKT7_9CYAN|nr:glycosyltransferase [Scytonema hofmannii FACHB-248]
MVYMDKRLHVVVDPSTQLYRNTPALVEKTPLPQCEISVIVPARNEAETLSATLSALAHQVDLQGQRLDFRRYEIILLLNNCSDNSATIAWNFAQQHPDLVLHIVEKTLPATEAYIGRVRQILMDEAYRRLISIGRKRGVIASTDGDSQVSETWIAATLYEINCGADAVGGRIITLSSDRATLDPYAKTCHLQEVGYRYLIAELESYLDPDPYDSFPRHYQHYGASLAVTAQMYAIAGGLPAVRTPEDVAFYHALVRVNARFRHSPLVRVETSARQTGRTDIGLANQLNEWSQMGRQKQAFLVESAAAIETRYSARHQLRSIWFSVLNGKMPTHMQLAPLADILGVPTQWLVQELKQPYTFGLLFERVEQRSKEEGIWTQRWQKVEIQTAISDLRLRLQSLRRGNKEEANKVPTYAV